LPEHVLFGKFDRSVSVRASGHKEELLVESFLTRASKERVFLELLKHFDVVQGIRPVSIRLLSYTPVVRSI
jgi:hypothetical protein